MLEFIFSVVPLILLCTGIGLVLINFDEVIGYLIFLAQSLISTPQITSNLPNNQLTNPTQTIPQKRESTFSILQLITKRISTLIRVVFLPDFNIPTITLPSNAEKPETNILKSVAIQQADALQVKTYAQPTAHPADPTNSEQLHVQNFTNQIHIHPLHVLKTILIYLLILLPFALIGATVMLYMKDLQTNPLSFSDWITRQLELILPSISGK